MKKVLAKSVKEINLETVWPDYFSIFGQSQQWNFAQMFAQKLAKACVSFLQNAK